MKNLILKITLVVFSTSLANAQSYNKIKTVGNGLHYIFYDSSRSKSTLIEFDNHLVLLEVPVQGGGAGAQNLKDHTGRGKKVLATLKHHFPEKPLKYILHSHWHPHSLSAVKPFLENEVTLISTVSNFKKLSEFVDSKTIEKYQHNIRFVESDSLILGDANNPIIVYRFLQKDYSYSPSAEYLYFYLPKYKAIHVGCMYNRWEGDLVEGKEIRTGREDDIHTFLSKKKITPAGFIRLDSDNSQPNNIMPYALFEHVINKGIGIRELVNRYYNLTESLLTLKKDSLITAYLDNHVPADILNSCTYLALRNKELTKAVRFAEWQVLVAPGDANVWDTLGEAYFVAGNSKQAALYSKQAKLLDSNYEGGESVWNKNLEDYRKQWQQK